MNKPQIIARFENHPPRVELAVEAPVGTPVESSLARALAIAGARAVGTHVARAADHVVLSTLLVEADGEAPGPRRASFIVDLVSRQLSQPPQLIASAA